MKIKTDLSVPATRRCSAIIALLHCLPVFSIVLPAIAGSTEQQVLTGVLEHRFDPTREVFNRSSVMLNDDGYRLESLPLEQGQVIIANTVLGKTWLVDNNRSVVHEVPYSRVEGVPELDEPFISLPGFIDSVPCSVMGGTRTGKVQFKGMLLEHWRCKDNGGIDDDELPLEQYYSSEHKLVLYSRSKSNIISELLDVKTSRIDGLVFNAPSGLQSVTIEQFMGVHQPLEKYRERQRSEIIE